MPLTAHKTVRQLSLLLLCCGCGAAAAQSIDEDLAQAFGASAELSIATGNRQQLKRAPAVASVITASDIAAMGATDLSQVLESVAGLHVSVRFQGYSPIFSFRGVHTKFNPQVLILVDGVPINQAFVGNSNVVTGAVPLENIARIEVIRGPGSALYGADAYSGVISIISKSPADVSGAQWGMRAGSFNSRDGWVQYGGALGPVQTALYFGARHTDGPANLIEEDAQTVLDRVFGTHASLAPGPLSSNQDGFDLHAELTYSDWRLRTSYQHRNTAFGVGVLDSLGPFSRIPTSRLTAGLEYQRPAWIWDWDLNVLLEYVDARQMSSHPDPLLLPPGAFGNLFPQGVVGNPTFSEHNTGLSAIVQNNEFKRHKLRAGAGWRVEDMYQVGERKNFSTDPFFPLPQGVIETAGRADLVYLLPQKRTLGYAFLQDEWTLAPDWVLTAGLRHDRYSDFGGTTNPRVALVWDAAYNVVIKALHGSAFRAPSFVETQPGVSPDAKGNPQLRPETIQTNELVMVWQPRLDLQTTLTLFDYRARDLVRFVADPGQTIAKTAQNVSTQRGRGLELEWRWDAFEGLRLSGNYSLQRARNEAGKDPGLAPGRRLFMRADWRAAPDWHLGATVNHVARRAREPEDTRAPIADYRTVDLLLRRERLFGHWEARLGIRNAFNADAREPSFVPVNLPFDLPLPRRNFYLQLQTAL